MHNLGRFRKIVSSVYLCYSRDAEGEVIANIANEVEVERRQRNLLHSHSESALKILALLLITKTRSRLQRPASGADDSFTQTQIESRKYTSWLN